MSRAADAPYSVAIPRTAVRLIGGLIGAVILLGIGLLLGIAIAGAGSTDALRSQVNPARYQAVFLTNNEVYFGRLRVPAGRFAYMTRVYRLTSQVTRNRSQPLRRTLVRLVTDVQSPEDELIINKAQILYVENLNPNGTGAKLLRQSNATP